VRSLALALSPLILAAAPAFAQYSVSSTSGIFPIPASGTGGGGSWPTALPSSPMVLPLAAPVPANATNIERVKILGLYHTWAGDLHMVLTAPNGARFDLLHRVGSIGNAVGFSVNFGANSTGADYTIVDVADPSIDQFWPATNPGSGVYLPSGTYPQEHGMAWGPGWPSGNSSIQVVPLSSIPATPGIWTLTIYDWAAADSGFLMEWAMEGDSGPSAPAPYCTAGTSTSGCVPSIGANAQPSTTFSTACAIGVANLEGQKTGLIFYGISQVGFSPLPWSATSTSFLCVKNPTQRTPPQSSGGTAGACDGALALDWNAYQSANPAALGNPWTVGDKVYVQAWYRDPPAPKTTNLSNALELTYQ
jgi:hypothetical protein